MYPPADAAFDAAGADAVDGRQDTAVGVVDDVRDLVDVPEVAGDPFPVSRFGVDGVEGDRHAASTPSPRAARVC